LHYKGRIHLFVSGVQGICKLSTSAFVVTLLKRPCLC
jgi:hypothetical protein